MRKSPSPFENLVDVYFLAAQLLSGCIEELYLRLYLHDYDVYNPYFQNDRKKPYEFTPYKQYDPDFVVGESEIDLTDKRVALYWAKEIVLPSLRDRLSVGIPVYRNSYQYAVRMIRPRDSYWSTLLQTIEGMVEYNTPSNSDIAKLHEHAYPFIYPQHPMRKPEEFQKLQVVKMDDPPNAMRIIMDYYLEDTSRIDALWEELEQMRNPELIENARDFVIDIPQTPKILSPLYVAL